MRGALAGELRKLVSTPSLRWTLLGSGAVVAAIAVFVGATGSLQPDDTVLGGALTGATAGQLLAAALGVLVVTGEISSGTMAATLAAVPRRGRVVAAKVAVGAGSTAAVGLVGALVAWLVGAALIDGSHPGGEPFPALAGVSLALGVAGAAGVAVGLLVRHGGGAIAAVVGVVLAPQLLGPLFGDLQPWVVGLSPATALQKMTQSSDAAAAVAGSLGPWPSLGAVAGVVAVLLVLAGRAFARRDI